MTFDQLLALIQSGGLVGVSLLILFGGYKGVWYFGNEVRKREAEALAALTEVKADRDEWKDMALAAIRTGEKIADANGGKR